MAGVERDGGGRSGEGNYLKGYRLPEICMGFVVDLYEGLL